MVWNLWNLEFEDMQISGEVLYFLKYFINLTSNLAYVVGGEIK